MLLFALTSDIEQTTDSEGLDNLLYGISGGDRDCLGRLYQATRIPVYSFALSILKSHCDAEDVLHDCYVAVWNGAEGYCSCGKPLAWILTITRNLCLQRLRDRKKTEGVPPEDWEPYLPDAGTLTPEEQSVLRSCMEQLSDSERQIVMLHAVAGFKHREIAALLKLPLSTVLSKYTRAIKKLKQYLQ